MACYHEGEGGTFSIEFYTGRLRPEVFTLTLLYTILYTSVLLPTLNKVPQQSFYPERDPPENFYP